MEKVKKYDPDIEALLQYANAIIATLREPFLVLNSKLQVISTNEAFYTVFKVDEKDVIGLPLADLGNGQWDIPELLKLLKEIILEKKVIKDYEVEHRFEQIGERVMSLNACQFLIPKQLAVKIGVGAEDGRLILVAIGDITESKNVQKDLQDSEERYRRAFETSRDGLLLVHKEEGSILNSNESAQGLLGYSPQEFLENKLWDIGVTQNLSDFKGVVSRLTTTGVIYYEDVPIRTKKGLSINVEVFLVDKAKVLQCNIRDIAIRKLAEHVIAETGKAKSDFTGMVSHELRTPLAAIKEGISLVLDKEAGEINEAQTQYLSIVQNNVDRLDRLITAVLSFQSFMAGKIKFIMEDNDINEIVNEVQLTMSPLAKKTI